MVIPDQLVGGTLIHKCYPLNQTHSKMQTFEGFLAKKLGAVLNFSAC